jgi:hypothetical protein
MALILRPRSDRNLVLVLSFLMSRFDISNGPIKFNSKAIETYGNFPYNHLVRLNRTYKYASIPTMTRTDNP